MRWSLRVGKIAGIGIYIHWTFLFVIGFVLFAYLGQGYEIEVALRGVLFVLALFGCIVLHELGHALCARRFDIPTRDITLLPIGGVARLERMPEQPGQEFLVAIAGPAVNVVIAGVIGTLLVVSGGWKPMLEIEWVGGDFWIRLMWINLILVVFNLLPAFPMDGGRVLRAILATRLEFVEATRIAAGVGQAMAIVFGLLGLMFNPFLLIIALFVFLGAQAESHSVQMTAFIRGLLVRDAAITDFHALTEEDSLGDAVEKLLAGSQQEFPVVREGGVTGILTRKDIIQALADRGRAAPVGEIMQRDYPMVEEDEPLEEAFRKMLQDNLSCMPVVRGGELRGLLTSENVGELVMVSSAIRKRRMLKS